MSRYECLDTKYHFYPYIAIMSSIDPTPPSSRGSSVPRGPRGEGAWAGISSRLFSSGGSSVGGSVNSSNSSISMSSSGGGVYG